MPHGRLCFDNSNPESTQPCWRSAGRMPKRASMERPEGRMPEGSVRRDGMGLTPSLRKRPAAMVRRPGACSSPSDFASTLRIGVANCVLRKAPRFLRVPPAGSSASEGSGTSVRRGLAGEAQAGCRSEPAWSDRKAGCLKGASGEMALASPRACGRKAPRARGSDRPGCWDDKTLFLLTRET